MLRRHFTVFSFFALYLTSYAVAQSRPGLRELWWE
jgi:hypothetical protein